MFATAKAGGVFIPLNTRLVPAEWAYILADSGASVLVWDEPFGDAVRQVLQELATVAARAGEPSAQRTPVDVMAHAEVASDGGPGAPPGAPVPRLVAVQGGGGQVALEDVRGMGNDEPLDLEVGLDDLFMIQYTSGTTGHPKGVMLSHGNISWNTTNGLVDLDLGSDEVSLVVGPLFHTAALNQQFMPTFIKGGTQYIEQSWDVDKAFTMLEERGITFFLGTADDVPQPRPVPTVGDGRSQLGAHL